MKHFSKMLGPVAVALVSLWATHASATNFGIVNSSNTGGVNGYVSGANTYMGVYNPAQRDKVTINQDGYLNGSVGSPFSFTDYWVFDLNPAGNVEINMTFNPSASIPGGLTVTLFSLGTATITGCAPAVFNNNPAPGSTCTTFGTAGLTQVALSNNGGNNPNLTTGPTFLSSGRYVIKINGVSTDNQAFYSGLFSTNQIPEPGSLALAGLALLGAAVTLRKRKTA